MVEPTLTVQATAHVDNIKLGIMCAVHYDNMSTFYTIYLRLAQENKSRGATKGCSVLNILSNKNKS